MRELFDAIAAGEVETVRRLVSDDATLAGCRNDDGVSARMLARYHGQTEIVGVLVDAGPELDVFEAAALGADERLDELLAHDRALVKARSADGFTPLHLASFFGHPQAARLLVERGADVADVARNELKVQPLHSAAAARQLEHLIGARGARPRGRGVGVRLGPAVDRHDDLEPIARPVERQRVRDLRRDDRFFAIGGDDQRDPRTRGA